jgi:acetaldehyde dehydrogenase (acetylating)
MENFDYDLRSIQEARDLARNGEAAAKKIAGYTAEQIDVILRSMAKAGEEHSLCLAQMAVEETGFGKVMDKAYKNHAASTLLYEEIKDMKTRGILCEDTAKQTFEVAEPVGLVMGIVPSTNPTSTVFFKSMIAIKSGNAIVFSPHPSAAKCTQKAAEVMCEAAIAAGAPEGIISCVTMPSMGSTNELMKCKEVSIIIATGGPGMVKAAYSAGKPAIGVGAGNSPAYIEKTADVKHAVRTIMASKTFDYGTICASEQSIICEESNHAEVVAELKSQGGYFMTKEETDKVCNLLFKNGHNMNAKFVGRSPEVIAAAAGITIPEGTKVLIGKQEGVGEGYPLSYEKLTTVLGFYTVKDWEEACGLSYRLLQNGIGHTMSIHTQDRDMVLKFAAKPASRILVNTGGSQGGTGISTGLPIAFTLGCGTCGGSSVSENVSPKHLLNVKTVAFGLKDCATIVDDDPTFMWKEKSQASSCLSPAELVASFEKKESTQAASCQSGCEDNDKLAALVKEIVLAMKGQ